MTQDHPRIVEPRWICPTWAEPGAALRVGIIGLDIRADYPALVLSGHKQSWKLAILEPPQGPGETPTWLTAAMPADVGAGLYTLRLTAGDARCEMPHCVAVPRAVKESFSFVHLSDSHLLKAGGGELKDRTPAIRQVARRVNELRPDFAIHTGDLISRYDGQKRPVDEALIWRQMQAARELLLELEVPLFVTPGNHDTGYPSARDAWREFMGAAWHGGTDDFSFDFGGYHFSVLERICRYDPVSDEVADCALLPAQKAWLVRDMAAAADAKGRFLFTHYDYDGALAEMLKELPIDVVFYGHSAKRCLPVPELLDGHLASGHAWRVVTIDGQGISSRLGPRYEP